MSDPNMNPTENPDFPPPPDSEDNLDDPGDVERWETVIEQETTIETEVSS